MIILDTGGVSIPGQSSSPQCCSCLFVSGRTVVYRPPNTSISCFGLEMSALFDRILNVEIVVCGDFNCSGAGWGSIDERMGVSYVTITLRNMLLDQHTSTEIGWT